MKSEDLLGTHSNLKEFLPFLDKLNNESDRGKVLIASGFLEEQLKQVLLAFMRESATDLGLFEGGNAPLGSLSSRIAASYGLGLITEDEHYDMTLIRKIRNDFAHNVHTTFEKPSIADRCKELRSRAQDYGSDEKSAIVMTPDGQFITAAVAIILRLVNRPHYVAKERRSERKWPY